MLYESLRAESILDAIGVCAMPCESKPLPRCVPKLVGNWLGLGERARSCCWITGPTDAATELVERATLRRTFRAIESLGRDGVST